MTYTAKQSANGTLTADTVATVSFGDNTAGVAIRYAYVIIYNLGSTTPAPIYFTTNNVSPTTSPGAEDTLVVYPGAYIVAANGLPWWSQAANVIPQTASTEGANLNEFPWDGTEVSPYGSSFYGQLASPGTIIQMVSAQPSVYSVEGTG